MNREMPSWMMPHHVTVSTYLGDNATGDAYSPAKTRRCMVDDQRQLVRSNTGDEVVSETTIRTRLAYADDFATDSRVVVNGRTSYVLQANRRDSGGIGMGDHLEISLR